MYLCTSGSNRDTISYFPIYMKHCTVSQANNDDPTLYSAPAVQLDHELYRWVKLRYETKVIGHGANIPQEMLQKLHFLFYIKV